MNNIDLEIKKQEFNLLDRVKNYKCNGNGIFNVNPCPICGRKDHFKIYAPNTRNNNNNYWSYYSFNECCKGGSIIDWLQEVEGYSKSDAIAYVLGENINSIKKTDTRKVSNVNNTNNDMLQYDFTSLANKLYLSSTNTDYFSNRGISDNIIKEYRLGYSKSGYNDALKDKQFQINNDHSKAYKYFIPLFDNDGICRNFIARQDGTVKDRPKTLNLRNVEMMLLNERYLYNTELTDKYIYICEGWADALTLESIKCKAIALNSISMINRLIDIISKNITSLKNKVFVVALDSDDPGEKASKKLINELNKINVKCIKFDINDTVKDINEAYLINKSSFIESINNFENSINEMFNTTEYGALKGTIASNILMNKLENRYAEPETKILSTGFPNLDKKIGGGLYNGLYVIGACSSIGKTTFVHQISDNIAKTGRKVLYFSLEMSAEELISKTFAREIYIDRLNKPNLSRKITSMMLRYNKPSDDIFEAIGMVMDKTDTIFNNIEIVEGSFNTTIETIIKNSEIASTIYDTPPVIVIDYLQIIRSNNDKLTDKQLIDKVIVELKQLSRKLNTPVIVISSINRQNYLSYIDFTSFKESGSIEYTADVVLGLQLSNISAISKEKNIDEKRRMYNDAKNRDIREIELVILKNRYGKATGTHNYKYVPACDYFEEIVEYK